MSKNDGNIVFVFLDDVIKLCHQTKEVCLHIPRIKYLCHTLNLVSTPEIYWVVNELFLATGFLETEYVRTPLIVC